MMRLVSTALASAVRGLVPRSLRHQLLVALSVLVLVAVVGSVVAVWALRESATAVRQLSQQWLTDIEAAQDVVQRTWLVERRMLQLVSSSSHAEVAASYDELITQLGEVDRLVARLSATQEDMAVLEVNQAAQLFRNTIHVVARLRSDALSAEAAFALSLRRHEDALLETAEPAAAELVVTLQRLSQEDDPAAIASLRDEFARQVRRVRRLPSVVTDELRRGGLPPAEGGAEQEVDLFSQRARRVTRDAALREYYRELQGRAVDLVDAAQLLAAHLAREYRGAVERVRDTSTGKERWLWALLAANLLIAWLVYRSFLGAHVLGRLQRVSLRLRGLEPEGTSAHEVVGGDDELGEMARAVEGLLKDRQRLDEANRELEDFSYSVSHDLRVPLRAIDGFSQLLLSTYGGDLDVEGQRLLKVVRSNSARMGHLIDNMLEFARIGRLELRPMEVDMGTLAREVMEELRPPATGGSLTFVGADVPPVAGDRLLLRHVLVNLLSNAIKFSRDREAPRIELTGVVQGDEVVYSVKDNGVGFDMRYVGKLFGMAQRLHSIEDFEGSGIGLAIVRRIVTRHGGRVWAEGRVNEGATVSFALPRRGPPSPASRALAPRRTRSGDAAP